MNIKGKFTWSTPSEYDTLWTWSLLICSFCALCFQLNILWCMPSYKTDLFSVMLIACLTFNKSESSPIFSRAQLLHTVPETKWEKEPMFSGLSQYTNTLGINNAYCWTRRTRWTVLLAAWVICEGSFRIVIKEQVCVITRERERERERAKAENGNRWSGCGHDQS